MKEYNFTGGMPDPESFPVDGLLEAAQRILPQLGKTLVRYPGDLGYIGLREVAVRRFKDREGVAISADRISITSGSMQGVGLILQTFLKPKDIVITEEFSYSGTLWALRHFQAEIVGIPTDKDGMIIDELEAKLKRLASDGNIPKMIYTIDTNQNPTGANLSLDRRKRMLELAKEYRIIIFEDNCYADIHFDGYKPPQSIFAFDDSKSTVYVESFSKIIGPGMRLGWVSAPDPYLGRILENRIDGGTSAFSAMILAEYLRENLWKHVEETNKIVKSKRDAVIQALEENMGDIASWTQPTGGLFIWIKISEETDTHKLQKLGDEKKIRFSRGQAFHSGNQDVKYIRLAYAFPPIEDIPEAIGLLAQCVRESQVSPTRVSFAAAPHA